jgi:hypothetical protein
MAAYAYNRLSDGDQISEDKMKKIATFVASALVTTGVVAAPLKYPAWELCYANPSLGFEFIDVNNIVRDGDIAKGWLLVRIPTVIVQRLAPEAKSLYKRAEKHDKLSVADTDKLRKALEKAVENDQPTSRFLVNCKTNQKKGEDDLFWEDITPGSDDMAISYKLCATNQ